MDALPYPVPQPDELMICPYNSSHAIEAKRMQYHLMKCRRQHIGQDFVTCQFNAKHEMPKVELRYHLSVCPDRTRINADLEYEANKNSDAKDVSKGCTDVPSYEYDFDIPEPSEDWDAETLQFPRVGVHPSTLNNPNVIKNITGLTRAEKKAFHQNLFQAEQNGGVPPNDGRLRAPQTQSFVHQTHRQPAPQPVPKPAPIFLTSKQNLPIAGVGRGSAVPRAVSAMDPNKAAVIMAMARGRGRPLVNAPGVQQYGGGNISSTSSSTESQDEETTNGPQTMEQKKREEKKLQKKLRQIQQLEDKQDMGEELSEEEQQKVAKREEIEMALKCLNLD